MMKKTPLQLVNQCHYELWDLIRLMGVTEVQLDETSDERIDLGEVDKVLRAMVFELGRIRRYMEKKDLNQRKVRQASEFALKAKIAKAGEAAIAHRQLCPDGQSHK